MFKELLLVVKKSYVAKKEHSENVFELRNNVTYITNLSHLLIEFFSHFTWQF